MNRLFCSSFLLGKVSLSGINELFFKKKFGQKKQTRMYIYFVGIPKSVKIMNSTKLNFINRSNDFNNSRVLIFQKTTQSSFDGLTITWKVIKNCGQGDYHPFTYEYDMQVTFGDSYGNFTYPEIAYPGDRFDMTAGSSGNIFQKSTSPAVNPFSIEVYNGLDKGSISTNIYKSGKLFATKNVVSPGQKAVFDFRPCIYVGVASEVEQGDAMDSAVLSEINKQIYLTGIASADLVMTGGGSGVNSTPFDFTLTNIVYA